MLIQKVHVKNFRSILDESLPCNDLTALVGRNGSGKSSFLTALQLFYEPSAKITFADFYGENTNHEIEIAVTFSDLGLEAQEFFSAYIDDELLTVVRVFSETPGRKSGTYYGVRLQNPDFVAVRNAGGNLDIRREYNEIRQKEKYSSFPSIRSADEALAVMAEWESKNPTQCTPLRDDGQFFGFTQVAQGYLGRFTRFIHIPAVRDASEDATESRGSPVTEVMDLVVRSALANRRDLADLKKDTQDRYDSIMDPANLTELTVLERGLSDTLRSYVPDASVLLRWDEFADISIPLPQAQVRLVEDNYESTVERTGHGLQRAFIVTMLQHLTAMRGRETNPEAKHSTEDNSNGGDALLPSLVLAIEEPELYQHPSRQRHLASVLLKLATGTIPGVAKDTQVIYTTHSPLLVGLEHFAQIRVLRKATRELAKPKVTLAKIADMGAVADELWNVSGRTGEKFTSDTLRPRLQAIMTPWMNEGFFADVVVLVEGEDDRAAVLGVARSINHDFDSQGITVIPCFGKANLDRPLVIFRQLGIPVYVVWDGDKHTKNAKAESNKYLLRLHSLPEEDWPNFVGESCACFEGTLERTLEDEIGTDLFMKLLSGAQRELEIGKKDQAMKNVEVIQRIIQRAASKEKTSETMQRIVRKIVALRTQREYQE